MYSMLRVFISCLAICFLVAPAAFAQSDASGIIWDAPILVSDTSRNVRWPRIALSGNDTVHVSWYGTSPCLPRLAYLRSTNSGSSFEPLRDLLTDSIAYPFHVTCPGCRTSALDRREAEVPGTRSRVYEPAVAPGTPAAPSYTMPQSPAKDSRRQSLRR
jgi:hypothetical protein